REEGKYRDSYERKCPTAPGQYRWIGAGRSWRTDLVRRIETIPGARQKQERQSNKNRAIRFQRSQRADPSSAYAQGKQNQWPHAASRCPNGRQYSGNQEPVSAPN